MSGNARETALRVLDAVRRTDAWADASLKAQLALDGLSGPDAALATRLVYGVLQNRMLLDFWLGAYSSQKPDHLQVPLADILRLGVYQIVFLDKIPDSAAVNESVELTKKFKRARASGFVNAVLRQIVRNKDKLPKVPKTSEAGYLSIQYSHPKWLVERLLNTLGAEETEALLQADNAPIPMTVQVNTLKTTTAALQEALTAAGITAEKHAWVPDCLELSGTGNLSELDAFQKGAFLVQDAAAKLVTMAAAPQTGMKILDTCAAPGGKSFSAAIAMGDTGEIVACDLHPNKLKRIAEGASRLGVTSIQMVTADGTKNRAEWHDAFDLVLVDAPCSGLGIIRKKPDVRYKEPSTLRQLLPIQAAILEQAASYVKPGGVLLYSTCTILPEENEAQTDAFLTKYGEFTRERFELPQPVGAVDGQMTLWPQRNGTDGFYICRMRRAKELS
ncbi:MAG: 16S rRNA (cytosine(967)-C(5))-methyltransferase RsmB [Oscillibacter sp.]|jgi:16S rRNA (cytosine967-C5)-methyltransferase|nr:16S rRNA (cytosine(967)-C(5))-methyltransferase RsmB [Oscillibacter sp.]